MSQLARQSNEEQSDTRLLQFAPSAVVQSPNDPAIGAPRFFQLSSAGSGTITSPSATSTSNSTGAAANSSLPLPPAVRSYQTLTPSPFNSTNPVIAFTSPSPVQAEFPSTSRDDSPPGPGSTAPSGRQLHISKETLRTGEGTAYYSDSSGPPTPDGKDISRAIPSRVPNDSRSASDPVLTPRPLGGSTLASKVGMGASSTPRADDSGTRKTSLDSTMPSQSQKKSGEESPSQTDIPSLIKAAGSPEAVIQYLLKEKQSQSQQNAQLWRLVDKQRAMILGLNKDLERALKEKEKYRKKLKEVMAAGQDKPKLDGPSTGNSDASRERGHGGRVKEQVVEVPGSPSFDSDSQKQSPMNMAMAPYPITPPADHPGGPQSAVGEILNPSHFMPKAQEHALDSYDHDGNEQAAFDAKKAADAAKDLPLHLSLPPSRSLPSKPPQGPPPKPPGGPPSPLKATFGERSTSLTDDARGQFAPPSAPPPRKPPPAPLQLRDPRPSPTFPPDEEVLESDSDYDDLLEVTEITDHEKRGRRRTREADDREREKLAIKEAELRSLSKKSQKSNDGEPTVLISQMPASPRMIPPPVTVQGDGGPASLAAMLSGEPQSRDVLAPPLMSPGLPASPRPMGNMPMGFPKSLTSPPLSPRGYPAAPLSPRPPRQPIPVLPNTPMASASSADSGGLVLSSPKPLNIVKKNSLDSTTSAPGAARESPTERTKVYRQLAVEEYPDLLLPPNALPSIDLKVASSRMKPSRASLISMTQLEEDPVFTLAVLSRADGGELWRVEKDSVSLAKLDQRLKQCSAFTARTPDRSLFSGHAPAKLDARRVALNQYLDELLNTPLDMNTALELCKYLSTNTLPPNADETGGQAEMKDDVPVLKTGPGGRPFKNGYLTKRGKNFGGWKARFFVLDGPHLKYYETPGGAHLGTIKLQAAQIGKQSQHNESPARPGGPPSASEELDNQYRHAFLILEPKKKDPSSMTKHVLCAESDRERDLWVDALLRWIDFRDPDDEDAKKEHERRGSTDSGRVNGAGNKKKSKKGQQVHQPTDSETLIGVNYEATQQGSAPSSGAPPKSEQHPTMSSQSPYGLPTPQPGAQESSWGSRLGGGLAPPNQDEKKIRKRSFFGFGTKTRTSSDGQDSLFGDSGGGQVIHSGPPRQVFGASLGDAVRFCAPTDVNVPLPAVVFRCIQYLDAKNAISEEGIFRLSGSNVVIKQLRERFNTEGDINLLNDSQYHDIHAIASLLKLYLRELPTTILTRELHPQFLVVTEMTDQREKLAAINHLAQQLPQANATLLKYLIAFLIKIINNADQNKMTVRNVGIVFSPTLNIPAPVFALLLQNYEAIFNIEPEEYELPSPASEKGSIRGPSLDHFPARPSTSQTNESPHRQRLLEQIRAQGGGGGTPPPGPPMQSRSTPTPPPQRQVSYEPSYLAQQSVPYPNSQYGGGRANPGYDRPLYETGPPQSGYNNNLYPVNNKASRRESAMFMAPSLSAQNSKSQLREDGEFNY